MSEKSCHAQVLREPCAATDRWRKENDADYAVRRAFARVRCWRIPPHWSTRDWLVEAQAIIQSAAACAVSDYDEARGVPLRAHIYMRATSAAWTRYRQEWSYHLHYGLELSNGVQPVAVPFERTHSHETIQYFLGEALSHLPVEDQSLVRQLFWNRTREERLGAMLMVSQQEVSRRKVRVLRLLHLALKSQAALLLAQLGNLCLVLLDDLDVIFDFDLNLFW